MKKKNNKLLIIILLVIIVAEAIAIYALATREDESSNTTTTITEEAVSLQTIESTLTSAGEIASSGSEQLTLNTSKYFKTMCVEENDQVESGDNILQYTDGTYLTATYDCVIESYSVPSSGSICTSSNYVQVQNLEDLTISLSISETEISKVSEGTEVTITISALDDKEYTGTISKVSEIGTYSSSGSTFSATVTLENDGEIKLGMSASCTIILEKEENVLCVPIEAVYTSNSEKYVVVVNNDGTTTDTTVTTGVSDDEYVQILTGLTEGQKVQITTTLTESTSSSGMMGGGGDMGGGQGGGGMDSSGGPGGMGGGDSMGSPPSGGGGQ